MEETSIVWEPRDIVYKSEPFAQVVYFENRNKYCDNCFIMKRTRKIRRSESSFSLIPCNGCNYVHYCSKACQEKAWDYHRKECGFIKTHVEDPPFCCDIARLVIKVLVKLEGKNLKDVKDKLGTGFVDFESLISSCTWPNRPAIATFLSFVRDYLIECLGETNLPENVDNIIITVEKYRFDVRCVGTAFYIGASAIKQVCIPTATVYFLERRTMYVRVIKRIPKDTRSSMVSISRFSFLDGRSMAPSTRPLILDTCTCSECTDSKNSVLYQIVDENLAGFTLESSRRAIEILHFIAVSGRKKLKKKEKRFIQRVLKQQETVLGRFHIYRIRLLASKAYFEYDLRQKACDLSALCILITEVFGEYSDQLTFVLEQRFELAQAFGWSEEKKDIFIWYQRLCHFLYH